jgi:hypothetical protein
MALEIVLREFFDEGEDVPPELLEYVRYVAHETTRLTVGSEL